MSDALVVIGAIGWGLLALGGITHLWHFDRLRELIAMHVDRDLAAATALVAMETGLAVALAIAALTDAGWLPVIAATAGLVGLGFTAWIARLLATDSDLPCACSFSVGPTSRWSLVRALSIVATVALAWAPWDQVNRPDVVVAAAVGAAVAGALFVLPEALSWPPAARGHLARLDAHRPIEAGR
ncbi:MAG: MauE/DoxX family redox-associated membrane protein [Actinomycetota bacterium]